MEADLLAAIREDPAADGPRLVYADWLTQRGDLLGELIVVGVQLAHTDVRDPQRYRLLRHAARLQQLTAARREFPGGRLDQLERGFPTRLVVDAEAIAELPAYAGPPPRTLAIHGIADATIADVLALSLAGVTALELHDLRGGVAALTGWSALAPLEHLGITGATGGFHALIDGPTSPITKLRSLSIVYETRRRRPEQFRELDAYCDLPRAGLERLELANLRVDTTAIERLGLRALSLAHCQASITRLAPVIARLEELRIDNVPGAGDDLAAHVAGNTALRRLRFAGPRYRETVTAEGLSTISNHCRGLQELAIVGTRLAEPAFASAITAIPELVELDLSHNDLVDASVIAIAAAANAPHLRVLRLSNNAIGDVGAEMLLTAPTFADLGILELGGNPISPRLAAHVTARFGDGTQ